MGKSTKCYLAAIKCLKSIFWIIILTHIRSLYLLKHCFFNHFSQTRPSQHGSSRRPNTSDSLPTFRPIAVLRGPYAISRENGCWSSAVETDAVKWREICEVHMWSDSGRAGIKGERLYICSAAGAHLDILHCLMQLILQRSMSLLPLFVVLHVANMFC